MVLDITLFRDEGDPDLIRESQRRRFQPPEVVDKVREADEKWKSARYELDQANQKRNSLQDEIQKKRKANENTDALVTEKKQVETRIEELKVEVEKLEKETQRLLGPVGNIVHASVPVSNNEDNNAILKTWGEFKTRPGLRHHHELLAMIDGYDASRGVGVAGHRGYFLKGAGVQLNFAIISYGIDFLAKRGYTMLQPPYLMNKDVMAETAQLEQFDEELYKVDCSSSKEKEDEKYLIATSEQPISAFHQNEWLEPKQLPLRYGGISTCFRKEAGAHGKDTWGIFRVHQFEKVEQFCITSPETSWEMHEEMLKTSEDFYQSLGIPYRVVVIVSGALNNAAAKKYDLEGWFPSFPSPDNFRELVSCSNCTDYQSRSLGTRYGSKKQGTKDKKYVHMLNSTLCATTRTICAILENYQTEEGIVVPEVLQPYLGGKKILPFVIKEEDLPKAKGAKGNKKEQKQNENKN
mmetsp:Transcript_29677/g.41781  ORF Transcript_29677/g.41781 Transcript_29677/m.41781 type:complete len:465 (-) Transcript_29677:3030-4424(-)